MKATPKASSQILHFKKETTVEKKQQNPNVNGAFEEKRFTWSHTAVTQTPQSCDSTQESTSKAEQQRKEKPTCPTSLFS